MTLLRRWWFNDLSKWVKFVLFVLVANGVPAFFSLMVFPNWTELLFVWTVEPTVNARLVGVMYSNALLLVVFAIVQPNWPRARVNMVIITLFSVMATILTFFYLKPFLAHPWYHLAYWLTMYFILFFAAPVVFVVQEYKHGGRLPALLPLGCGGQVVTALFMLASLVVGLGFIFGIDLVNAVWPWTVPPLVGGLIGILFLTHAAAYGWSIWDGDWHRIRPIYWQAPITALLFMLLPPVHWYNLRAQPWLYLLLYYILFGGVFLISSVVIIRYSFFKQIQGGSVELE